MVRVLKNGQQNDKYNNEVHVYLTIIKLSDFLTKIKDPSLDRGPKLLSRMVALILDKGHVTFKQYRTDCLYSFKDRDHYKMSQRKFRLTLYSVKAAS